MDVSKATFVVTDVETTGTSATSDRLLEIGAAKVRGGEVVDEYRQLVNPGRSVPSRITQLTGITTGMVFEAPSVDEVLPEYRDFLGDGIFVAHNLTFDERFLNAALERHGAPTLSNETLCTLRLARRLLPGLDSKGLSRLSQFYDIDVDGRHRALGDAMATSVVLRRFLRQLDYEHEIDAVDEVLAFQYRQYQQVRHTPEHIERIREEVLPEVPEAPGVYELTDRSGAPIYIGKAKNLSNRLSSHFTAVESRDGRKRKMLQNVRDVTWETTGTELEAMIRESRRITAEKPRYNRAQRRYYSRPFIRLDASHEYPALSWTHTLRDDGAEYYGPVRNGDQADVIVDVVGRSFRLRECDDQRLHLGQRCLYADMDRCTAPCETESPEQYARVVERVRRFLTGQDRSVVEQLHERMQRASTEQRFEKAAAFRDELEVLEPMLEKQQVWAAPVRNRNGILVQPGPGDEQVRLYFVRYGQLVATMTASVPFGAEDLRQIDALSAQHLSASEPGLSDFTKRDVNEVRLLAQWSRSHREEITVIRRDEGQTTNYLTSRVVDVLCSNQAPVH